MVLAIFQIGSLVFCAKKLWFFGFGAHYGLWIFCCIWLSVFIKNTTGVFGFGIWCGFWFWMALKALYALLATTVLDLLEFWWLGCQNLSVLNDFPTVLQFLIDPNAPLSKEWPQPPKSGDYLIEEKITVFLGKVFRTLPTAHLIQGYCLIQCDLIRSVYMMGQCYLIHAHSCTNCVRHFMVCSRFCDG